jgi:hypothetical protein
MVSVVAVVRMQGSLRSRVKKQNLHGSGAKPRRIRLRGVQTTDQAMRPHWPSLHRSSRLYYNSTRHHTVYEDKFLFCFFQPIAMNNFNNSSAESAQKLFRQMSIWQTLFFSVQFSVGLRQIKSCCVRLLDVGHWNRMCLLMSNRSDHFEPVIQRLKSNCAGSDVFVRHAIFLKRCHENMSFITFYFAQSYKSFAQMHAQLVYNWRKITHTTGETSHKITLRRSCVVVLALMLSCQVNSLWGTLRRFSRFRRF